MQLNSRYPGLPVAMDGVWPGIVRSTREFAGTPGDDRIKGRVGDDYIDVSQGGDDYVTANRGDDTIYYGAAFTGADQAKGGIGFDTVILDGDYSAGVEVQADSFLKVEKLVLEGGSYVLTGDLWLEDASGYARIDASGLAEGETLNLNVATRRGLNVLAGAGDDILHASANGGDSVLGGGGGDDTLVGGVGASFFFGDIGADRIVMSSGDDVASYSRSAESIARSYDTIENLEASGGRIELRFDSNTDTAGLQHDFHLGETANRAGDITFRYDTAADETIVKVFTGYDEKADFVLHLTGNVALTVADFIFG
jgi:Ca2+-binding RTX toxin-like protein